MLELFFAPAYADTMPQDSLVASVQDTISQGTRDAFQKQVAGYVAAFKKWRARDGDQYLSPDGFSQLDVSSGDDHPQGLQEILEYKQNLQLFADNPDNETDSFLGMAISEFPAEYSKPVYSDSGLVAYISNRTKTGVGDQNQVWLFDPETNIHKQVTNVEGMDKTYLRWTNDLTIEFHIQRPGMSAAYQSVDLKTGEYGPQEEREGFGLGDRIPLFKEFAVPDMDSTQTFTLEGGDKPTVLNIFKWWCGPCIKEMPGIVQFQDIYGDRVNMLGFTYRDTSHLEYGDDKSPEARGRLDTVETKGFVAKHAPNLSVAVDNKEGGPMEAYFRGSIPVTIVVDKNGLVHFRQDGSLPVEDFTRKDSDFVKAVERALKE